MRFPFYRRPIENINGSLYIVHAEYPYDKVKDIQGVKQWLGVDHVFRSNKTNSYIFCEIIQDVDWEPIT